MNLKQLGDMDLHFDRKRSDRPKVTFTAEENHLILFQQNVKNEAVN